MKNSIFVFILIMVFYYVISNFFVTYVEIPDAAIRMRVIPNSNSKYDQEIKSKVKDKLQSEMTNLLSKTTSVDIARTLINENINSIDKNIEALLKKEKYELGYKINFGYNYFPEKKYKGITYKEGMYESLYVTLGSGSGDNWWCVLFPPLCLLEAEEGTSVEYKSFVKEILDKYF